MRAMRVQRYFWGSGRLFRADVYMDKLSAFRRSDYISGTIAENVSASSSLSRFGPSQKCSTLRQALPEVASSKTLGAGGLSFFHHFPIRWPFVVSKCRQFSVLGLTRGSLGS